MGVKKLKVYSNPNKTKLIALALTGLLFLTSCSQSFITNVRKEGESYKLSSLEVLVNEEYLYHICQREEYKTVSSTEYGQRYGFGFNPKSRKYEYGNTYGEITKNKYLYSYIDIDTKEKVADDEDMNGFSKTRLSRFFSEEEYEAMNGRISYEDVVDRVASVINVPAKVK